MRTLPFILLMSVWSTFAQAEEKACRICKRVDAIMAANDVDAAARFLGNFPVKPRTLTQQEADAVTRIALRFIPLDKEASIDELYYDIYQDNPIVMKYSLIHLRSKERWLLERTLKQVACVWRHGQGGPNC